MTNDILDQLRTFRPDAHDLGRRWPKESRDTLAERIRAGATAAPVRLRHRPRSRRGRLLAASTLVAAAAVAAVAVPALIPSDAPGAANPAAAAALHRLARIAARAPADVAGPGQFVHTVTREHQVGVIDDGTNTPQDHTVTFQRWVASDGRLWQTYGGARPSALYFPAHDGDTSYIASLPADPGELDAHLRRTVTGSDSTDEAVFVAVGDLLREQNVPAALRSAAVTVLSRTDHVTLGPASRDELGRPAQQFDFTDDAARPGVVESLFFDPDTAQLIDERTSAPTLITTSSVLRSDVVNSVPEEILRTAVTQN